MSEVPFVVGSRACVVPPANVVGRAVVGGALAAVGVGNLAVVDVVAAGAATVAVLDAFVELDAATDVDEDETVLEDPLDTVVDDTAGLVVLSAVVAAVVAGVGSADVAVADDGAADEGVADGGGVAAGAAAEGAGASADAGVGDVVSAASAGAAAMVAVATIELIVNRVLRDMLSTSAGS
jgi:hypothetical protein